jgi:vacuolar-type H+-ATPase catalytic subunit A/Vma1
VLTYVLLSYQDAKIARLCHAHTHALRHFCGMTVEVAKIIREDFLAQNAYSPYDPCCPFYKSVWMLKNICLFYSLALKSVELSSGDRKINLNTIKQHMNKTIYKITAMKFEDPKDGEEVLTTKYKALHGENLLIIRAFFFYRPLTMCIFLKMCVHLMTRPD